MLSDEAIDKLVEPIVTRQEKINQYILNIIAERIKEVGTLLPSDIYKLERLLRMGGDVRKINKYLAEQTGLQENDIKKLIRTVAIDNYTSAKSFYDYRLQAFIPFAKNEELQKIVEAVAQATVEEYRNMSNATGFMIRDRRNPTVLRPSSIAQTYQSVVDEAIQAVQSGSINYNTAMKRTIQQLNASGLRRVTYNTESGRVYTQRLDTAVKRNLMDGIRAINQGVQDETGRQYGATGKEISVHEMSAPDHEPIQGHQFTNEEWEKLQSGEPFEDVEGEKFDAIGRHIGEWNCRHFAWSIVVGSTKPTYTKEQLKQNIERNNKGYTLPNGKHLSLYDCSQKMRELETQIRYTKESQMMAVTAGNNSLAEQYQAKVSKRTKEYVSFCKACGLKPKMSALTVDGYKKVA